MDYKIVSKYLSLHLRKALPFIIKQDQTCSVPGRSISDNVHLFRNIFDFVERKELRYALLNLDQAKALDRVSTNYLFKVLSFGFGSVFMSWIKLLYTDISSCVIMNGHIVWNFQWEGQSVRAVPSPLYCMFYPFSLLPIGSRESLVSLVCRCQALKRKSEFLSMLTTLVVTDENLIPLTFSICREFGLASGAKSIMDKTCGIWLERWKDRGFTIRD